MAGGLRTAAWRALCAAGLLTCAATASAYAQNGYWHGALNANWNQGVTTGGGASNWYSEPPSPPASGTPLPVPAGVAVFAAGGLSSVVITKDTRIATMRLAPDAPQYFFSISGEDRTLDIDGKGIINQSQARAPRIVISDRAILQFHNSARIVAGDGNNGAEFTIVGGILKFRGESNGGHATVYNANNNQPHIGRIVFVGHSSAAHMRIRNVGPAHIAFSGQSTAGNAHLVNEADFFTQKKPVILFVGTGPAGDGRTTAGRITNDAGTVLIGGQVKLTVLEDFTQRANGSLYFSLGTTGAGSIHVKGTSKLAGELIVNNGQIAGRHVLFRAAGARTGVFSKVRFTEFAAGLKGRVAYMGRDVVLFIEPK